MESINKEILMKLLNHTKYLPIYQSHFLNVSASVQSHRNIKADENFK